MSPVIYAPCATHLGTGLAVLCGNEVEEGKLLLGILDIGLVKLAADQALEARDRVLKVHHLLQQEKKRLFSPLEYFKNSNIT